MLPATTNRIGKYEIQAELGRGGFGVVYRAFDPTVGRLVAVKVLTSEGSQDLLSRFRNEAAAAGNLHHKNVVTIYEFGDHNGLPFIAMEFLEGEDLHQVIAAGKPLTLLEKVTIMGQVADGLYCAHRNGVVHRDVKPANIRLLPDGTIKILDFGIARLVHDAIGTRLTRQGHVIGTLLYMAPEQILGAEIDALCDIFAYGASYYELLTGHHPFQADDPRTVFYKITSEDPEPIRNSAPDCPDALEQVVRRAMHKDRELRYQNLRDLQLDTEPILLELRQERSAALLTQAHDLVAREDLDAAQAMLSEAVDLDPVNRAARQLRETVQARLRRRVLRGRIDALVTKAHAAMASGKYTDSISDLEAALRLDRENPEVEARLAEVRQWVERSRQAALLMREAREDLSRQNLAEAFRKASAAIQLDPRSDEGKQLLSSVQQEIDRREDRRKLDEKLRQARELLLMGSFDDARAVLDGLDPFRQSAPEVGELRARIDARVLEARRQESLRSELGVARQLLDQLRFAEAVTLLERLKPEFPQEGRVSDLLRHAQHELNALERAQAIDALRAQILALAEAQDFDRALQALDQALGTYAGESSLVRLRETVLSAKSRRERERAVDEVVERYELLRGKNRFSEASRAVESALKLYEGDPALLKLRQRINSDWEQYQRSEAVRSLLAESDALIEERQPRRAIAVIEAALASYPEDTRLAAALSRSQAALRSQQRAAAIERIGRDAGELVQAGEFERALEVLDAGLGEHGADPALVVLRQRAESARDKRVRQRLVPEALREAERLAGACRFAEAIAVLEKNLAKHPDEQQLSELLLRIRNNAEQHGRNEAVRRICEEARSSIEGGDPAKAVGLLSAASAKYPGQPELLAALPRAQEALSLRQRAEAIQSATRDVQLALQAGNFDGALQVVAETAKIHGPSADIQRLREQVLAAKTAWERDQFIGTTARQCEESWRAGRFQEALEGAEAALQKYPDAPTLTALAQALRADWERRQRGEAVRRVLADARVRLADNEPAKAIDLLRAASTRFPGTAELERALASAEETLRAVERAKASQRFAAEAHTYLAQNEFHRALDALDRGLRAYPGDASLTSLRDAVALRKVAWERDQEIAEAIRGGEALLAQRQFEQAERAAAAAFEQYPGQPGIAALQQRIRNEWESHKREEAVRVALNQAEALVGAGQPKRAMDALQAALARYPGEQQLSLALARTEESLRALERAEAIGQTAREARAQLEANEFDRAAGRLDQALRTYPGEASLLELKSSVEAAKAKWLRDRAIQEVIRRCEDLLAARKFDHAGRELQTALEKYPGEPALLALQQRLQAEWERQRRAEAIHRAIEDAQGHMRQRRPARAVELLEAAAAQYPGEPDLSAMLARAQAAVREQERAEEIERVCRETRLYIDAKDFGRAAEIVQQSLRAYSGEDRLTRLQQSVIAARSEWEGSQRASTEMVRPGSAYQSAQAVTDEVKIPLPPPPGVTPLGPPTPVPSRRPEPGPQPNGRRYIAAAVGVVALAGASIGFWRWAGHGVQPAIEIAASPADAVVRINGRECRGPKCSFSLPPGQYQLEVRRDGYEPRIETVSLGRAGAVSQLNVALKPIPSRLRLSANFAQGQVVLDGSTVGFQDGQLVLDRVAPGTHELKVSGPDGGAALSFATEPGRLPAVNAPVRMEGVSALVVTNLGGEAQLICPGCAGPVAVDGNPAGDLREGRISLNGLSDGPHTVTLRTGGSQRSLVFQAMKAPSVSVSITSERNVGAVVVETAEDGALVFIDGRRQQRTTSGGQLVVQLDAAVHSIRVEKKGYRVEPPELKARVGKGEQVRAVFSVKPEEAVLVIDGALPDTRVTLDGRLLGSVRPDGGFAARVPPGAHKIELAKNGYVSKARDGSFGPGGTIRLERGDVQLAPVATPVPPQPKPAKTEPPPPPKPDPMALEAQQWEQMRSSRSSGELEAFLRRFPNGPHTNQVQLRLEQLDWEATSKADKGSLAAFLAKHSNGTFAQEARNEVARLDKTALAETERRQGAQQLASERAAIREVLNNLAAAYDSKDVSRIGALWPTMPPGNLRELRAQFRNFRSFHVTIQPLAEAEIARDAAHIQCSYSSEVVDQAGPHTVRRTVTIGLVRTSGRWFIDSMQ